MIVKSKVLGILGTLMLCANSVFAVDMVKMNPVNFFVETTTKPSFDPILQFDVDSIVVDHANGTVNVILTIEHPPFNKDCREYRIEQLTLRADSTNSKAKVLQTRYYNRLTNKLENKFDMGAYAFADTSDLSARYGKYHINNELQREFGYFLNLPNEDGTPYLTPKAMGLTWIKSTGTVGVFYYPDSVKVKNHNVDVKVAFWYPKENRVQTIKATLDYDKQLFKPKTNELRRINTGEIIISASKGLIPGLIGPAFKNSSFNSADEARILSEYFKSKVAK